MMLKKRGEEVQGLTTAAGIWAVGAIGLAVGAGMYLLGISTAALVGLILASERILNLDERLARWRANTETEDPQEDSPFDWADASLPTDWSRCPIVPEDSAPCEEPEYWLLGGGRSREPPHSLVATA